MPGKKPSPHKRLKRSLQNLPKEKYNMAYLRTVTALKTRKALDKMGISNNRKRRKIHRIVQQRIFGNAKTEFDYMKTSFRLGMAKSAIKAGRSELAMPKLTIALSMLSKELGGQAKLDEFWRPFSSYFVRLKSRKKK